MNKVTFMYTNQKKVNARVNIIADLINVGTFLQ